MPIAYMLLRRTLGQLRFLSSKRITSRDIESAFAPEVEKIKLHSSLINQTSWQGLVHLDDINPMMETFRLLASKNAVSHDTLLDVSKALSSSAKEGPVLFRSLLEDVRLKYQAQLHADLADHCDKVASAILEKTVPTYIPAIGALLGTYEIVDPAKGAAFYLEGQLNEVGGSAIPCLVKSNAPLEIIEAAYANTPRKAPRVKANMAWAYLKYNKPERAVEIKNEIKFQGNANVSAERFLISAFIGDAPLELARATFHETTIAPHHSSMVRLVNAAWASNHSVSEQLALFERYLELAKGLSESAFKPVTYAVTANIIQADARHEQLQLNHLIRDVKQLINVYSKHPAKALFLNILLTHVAKNWSTKEALIMPVLQAYGADTSSPVTYRVRLNSLAKINPKDKEKYIRRLWKARCQLWQKIDPYDWIALSKADHQIAKSIYQEMESKEKDPRVRRALRLG